MKSTIMKSTILIAVFLLLMSCKQTPAPEPVIPPSKVVTEFQTLMLNEVNFLRTKPAEYAELRLKEYYDRIADNGSYLVLKSLTPMNALVFNYSLNKSATEYAGLMAEKNLTAHDSETLKRAISAGYTGTSVSENIAADIKDIYNGILNPESAAIGFVRLMIIDEGVADLGHRVILINPNYKTLGIGFGRNPSSTYINYTVQVFGYQ